MWTKGGINAKALGDQFTQSQITAGTAEVGDAVTGVTVSHGLSGTPTFLLGQWHGLNAVNSDRVVHITASATEIRLFWTDTDAATTASVSYVAGILS